MPLRLDNASALPTCPQLQQKQQQTADRNWPRNHPHDCAKKLLCKGDLIGQCSSTDGRAPSGRSCQWHRVSHALPFTSGRPSSVSSTLTVKTTVPCRDEWSLKISLIVHLMVRSPTVRSMCSPTTGSRPL